MEMPQHAAISSLASMPGIHSSTVPRKLVVLLGVEDLIVVDTEDSLLICKRGSSQDVKKVVDILEDKKKKEYL